MDGHKAIPAIEEIEEGQTETAGVMPELSDCSASLTKEDIKNFEVELNVIWSRNLMPCNLLPFAMDSGGNYYALNLKNKKIYYYLTDEWDENASREYNFETNTRYIAQSFNYFINHFIEEEE